MSNVEISLIVLVCIIPIIALVVILPKLKKKKNSSAHLEPQVYEQSAEPTVEGKDEPNVLENPVEEKTYTSDDFKSYLENKKQTITKPSRKDNVSDFDLEDYEMFNRRHRQRSAFQPSSKSISEQFDDLTPEMKALIIAGVLDPKDYSKY